MKQAIEDVDDLINDNAWMDSQMPTKRRHHDLDDVQPPPSTDWLGLWLDVGVPVAVALLIIAAAWAALADTAAPDAPEYLRCARYTMPDGSYLYTPVYNAQTEPEKFEEYAEAHGADLLLGAALLKPADCPAVEEGEE